jgi:AraC family transcriptional regulator of adaptative response / DNA-3-methyladenine glycosylase II
VHAWDRLGAHFVNNVHAWDGLGVHVVDEVHAGGRGYGAGVTTSRTHRLPASGPYDAARLLAFHGVHAVPGVESWDGTRWTAALGLPGGPAVIDVGPAPGGVDVRLHLTDPADEPAALDRVRHALDLDTDIRTAQQRLAADDLLAPLITRRPGLRVPGTLDAWETLVRTVIGQQVSLAGARTVTATLVRAAGEPLPASLRAHAPRLTHRFPTPAAVAALPAGTPAFTMPRSRAGAVMAAAALFADQPMPARAELLALPGIGPWTVDYLDLRARRDPDVLLATDLAVRRAVERLGHDGSPKAVAQLGRRWAPFRSLAMLHLWAEYLAL